MRFENEKGFNIQYCSDIDIDELFVEIYFESKLVASIIKNNLAKYDLVFPNCKIRLDIVTRIVDFDGFMKTVQLALGELKGSD